MTSVSAPGVLSNDTDADSGDTLTAHLVADVTDGVLSLNSDGSFTYDPDAGWSGADGFTLPVAIWRDNAWYARNFMQVNRMNACVCLFAHADRCVQQVTRFGNIIRVCSLTTDMQARTIVRDWLANHRTRYG